MTEIYLTDEEIDQARQIFDSGGKATEILKWILARHPDYGTGHLVFSLMDAFGVSSSDVSYIGGWLPEGKSELSDADIDAYIGKAIKASKAKNEWDRHRGMKSEKEPPNKLL